MLSIRSLSAGYGKLVILQEVEMEIPAGRFIAILGPNGSGKSTLLKSVFGLTTIFGGVIELGGRDLHTLPTEQISAVGVSYTPQRENVFASMTVLENLELATRNLKRKECSDSLDRVYELFPSLRDRQQVKAGRLSGGERQMLAIALGWVMRPRLMLLDEPSAGLSPLFVTEVFRTLRLLCDQGATLAVVEQNARSVLRWCDAAYVLRAGQVVFHGSAEEMQRNEEIVKGYLGVSVRPL
jgi:ABC-type branched-subunit amino acid transport system ATPase component